MKKLLAFPTFLAMSLAVTFALTACGKESDSDFYGKWKNDNMQFEIKQVASDNGSQDVKVQIVNENGTLSGIIADDTLKGKNELGMEFKMVVKGDSGFYTFADIVSKYVRVR